MASRGVPGFGHGTIPERSLNGTEAREDLVRMLDLSGVWRVRDVLRRDPVSRSVRIVAA